MLNSALFSGLAVGQRAVHLRVIETTDLHQHLLPYDYYADRPLDGIGLAHAAHLIDAARAEAANALLFDNGDFLQGTPMGDLVAYEKGLREGDLHPVMAAMNALQFDAITLGNHEFNYGLDFLMKALTGAAFPVVFVRRLILLRPGLQRRARQQLRRVRRPARQRGPGWRPGGRRQCLRLSPDALLRRSSERRWPGR